MPLPRGAPKGRRKPPSQRRVINSEMYHLIDSGLNDRQATEICETIRTKYGASCRKIKTKYHEYCVYANKKV